MLKRSNVPLTKTVTLTVRLNKGYAPVEFPFGLDVVKHTAKDTWVWLTNVIIRESAINFHLFLYWCKLGISKYETQALNITNHFVKRMINFNLYHSAWKLKGVERSTLKCTLGNSCSRTIHDHILLLTIIFLKFSLWLKTDVEMKLQQEYIPVGCVPSVQ